MNIKIKRIDIIKNIFQNRLYLLILLGSIVVAFLLPFTAQKFIVPSFYNQLINNTLDDAKKVGTHIARHQDYDKKETVFYTAIDKLKSDFNLYKVRLFDKNGEIIFSTKNSEIGDINKNDYYFDIVSKGEMFYKVVKKGEKSYEGITVFKDVVEIYVPIMKNGQFKGSSEIYYDITDKKVNFNSLMNKINFFYNVFAALFIFGSFIIIYILSKDNLKDLISEKELQEKVNEKTKQLQEVNKSLEVRVNQEIEKNREKEAYLFQQSKLAAMGEMIGNIAHQWRQPLSMISTSATGTLVQKEMNTLSDNDLKKSLESINNTVQHLSQTIEDFRGFYDPRNNKKEEFLISSVIEKSLNLVSSQFAAKEISIIKNIKDIKINSIQNGFIQVLVNVLNNSRDALLKVENQERIIFITTYKKGKNLIVEIKDNAYGIPEEIINKIFDPYFTTKHQSQGTGIGLYMSQDIVTSLLKGNIFVANETFEYQDVKYKGAKFVITIPLDIE